jgi:DnaJ-related protein SCJ1
MKQCPSCKGQGFTI